MNGMVVCDLDGTLIDSRADLAAAVNKVRAEHDLPPISVETATSYVGDGVRKLIERALSEIDTDIDAAVESMRRHYSRGWLNETRVYPTVFEGLETLREAGFKLAVATNKPQGACEAIIDGLGLTRCFDVVLGGSPDYPLKPDPAMLLLAIERGGADSTASWMIGDNHTDLASGRNAGLRTCFAKYGFGSAGDEGFDIEVDSFAEFANHCR
jgi:phosphoglycolate phosphatase